MSKITDVKAALASATPDWQLVATLKSDDQHIATFSADADANIALVARENLAAFVALYDAGGIERSDGGIAWSGQGGAVG